MRKRWQKVLPFHLAATSFSLVFSLMRKFPQFPKKMVAFSHMRNFSQFGNIFRYLTLCESDGRRFSLFTSQRPHFLVFFPLCEIVLNFKQKNGSIFPHAIFFSIWKYISLFGLMRKRWQKVLPFHLAATSFSLVFFPYAKFCSILKQKW